MWMLVHILSSRTTMRFYRFELTFDGELQHVGLFQGLDDAIPDGTDDLINSLFPFLPIPETEPAPDDGPLCCWFTEQGLDACMSGLREISLRLDGTGWGLCAAVIDAGPADAVYTDSLQAVFRERQLNGRYAMTEIERVEDVRELSVKK